MQIINTNLEKEFNLTPMEELTLNEESETSNTSLEPVNNTEAIMNRYKELDKIDSAMPQVYGLDATDEELDSIANTALDSYKELMEMAMNVEQRFAGDISSSAATMLGHALNARTNKIKKKLDIIELQIKKQIADHKTKGIEEPDTLEGKSQLLDRNELLNHLLKKP
jgi:hypothetical protein